MSNQGHRNRPPENPPETVDSDQKPSSGDPAPPENPPERVDSDEKPLSGDPLPPVAEMTDTADTPAEPSNSFSMFETIPDTIDFDPFEGIDLTTIKPGRSSARDFLPEDRGSDDAADEAAGRPAVSEPTAKKPTGRRAASPQGMDPAFDPLDNIDRPNAVVSEMHLGTDDLDTEDDGWTESPLVLDDRWELTPAQSRPSRPQPIQIKSPTKSDWWPEIYDYVEIHRLKEKVLALLETKHQKSIMITSPHDDAGCTFLTFMLSFSAASFSRMRVLMVDLNLRRPELHRPFDLQVENGFTEIASGALYWKDAVKNTSFGGLKIITAGRREIDLSFAIRHSKIKEMLDEMKADFDLILFDTSPALTHSRRNVDPAFLGYICDMVLIVVQDTITKKQELAQTVETITSGGGKIKGVIYNQKYRPTILPRFLRRLLRIETKVYHD